MESIFIELWTLLLKNLNFFEETVKKIDSKTRELN